MKLSDQQKSEILKLGKGSVQDGILKHLLESQKTGELQYYMQTLRYYTNYVYSIKTVIRRLQKYFTDNNINLIINYHAGKLGGDVTAYYTLA